MRLLTDLDSLMLRKSQWGEYILLSTPNPKHSLKDHERDGSRDNGLTITNLNPNPNLMRVTRRNCRPAVLARRDEVAGVVAGQHNATYHRA
jgi:hypothetical protein